MLRERPQQHDEANMHAVRGLEVQRGVAHKNQALGVDCSDCQEDTTGSRYRYKTVPCQSGRILTDEWATEARSSQVAQIRLKKVLLGDFHIDSYRFNSGLPGRLPAIHSGPPGCPRAQRRHRRPRGPSQPLARSPGLPSSSSRHNYIPDPG